MRPHRSSVRIGTAIAAATLVLVACGGGDDGPDAAASAEAASTDAESVDVADAWSRQPAAGQSTAAVYVVVSNPTGSDVTIESASSPTTDRVELHETIANDDGTMQMRFVDDGFVVPAGGEFAFESGGPHIMLFDIDAATYPTDQVEVTLTFDTIDPITFDAEVRALDGGAMDMDDMSDMDHEMDDMDGDSMDQDMSDMDEPGHALDVSALHDLDEELAAGTLDSDRQRAVVADYISMIEAESPSAGSSEAGLLELLHELDAALADSDLDAAAAAAGSAHGAAHALTDHG